MNKIYCSTHHNNRSGLCPECLALFEYAESRIVKARDTKGRLYDIEVQSTGDRSFVNRSLYYWARLYSSQLVEGESYKTLRPTICINLQNFEIFPEISKAHS